jgi:hypothetical protein
MCLCVGREIFSVLVLITQPRMVVRSARLSVMISHKAGQADPPKVIHRAIDNMLSKIVRLYVAVLLARVQQWNAASMSTLQIYIFV